MPHTRSDEWGEERLRTSSLQRVQSIVPLRCGVFDVGVGPVGM